MDLGIILTVLIGPSVPLPAPREMMDALEMVEITHSDEPPSGFQMTFRLGRSGTEDLLDYSLLSGPLLRPCSRVILIVIFNAVPTVLMDGIITNQQLAQSSSPGETTLVVTGEDVSVMMDMEEKSAEHPAQDETVIALKLIASYAQYGLIPDIRPPPAPDPPIPIERIPVQTGTDLDYLKDMAARFGYVFYITSGPLPFMNTAYWGPPKRIGIPQPAISVNMGPNTNVESVSFQYNSLTPANVSGKIQDRLSHSSQDVQNIMTTRFPLSLEPALLTQQCVKTRTFRSGSGLNVIQAMARAQGQADASVDCVTAEGEVDAVRYGHILQARGTVGLRGAGNSYDGLYYVKKVTHMIKKGSYTQKFTLTRDGLGSTAPVVLP